MSRSRAVKRYPPKCCRQIVRKTDGVPLFVEELTKMVLESGLYAGSRWPAMYVSQGPLSR